MIGDILKFVAERIGQDINSRRPTFDSGDITIGNISQLENSTPSGKILMSVVNVEQDAPLRNNPSYTPISDTQIRYHNPKVVLNLYVLFTAFQVTGNDSDNRATELNYLTEVMASLQKKHVFIGTDLPISINDPSSVLQTEKIIFDLYSLPFEQMNHLWGILGGRYLPSVIYKVRLVSVFVNEGTEAEVIQSIERKENVIN